jgi:hypothetical protein
MLRKSGLRKLSWLRRERSGQGESGAIECEPGLFEGRLSVWAPGCQFAMDFAKPRGKCFSVIEGASTGQFDCGGLLTGKRTVPGAYLRDGTGLVCTTADPRRIRIAAELRQRADAPHNPARTQRPTDTTRIHTGIAGRTSTNQRWQAKDCGRRMTDAS